MIKKKVISEEKIVMKREKRKEMNGLKDIKGIGRRYKL